MGAPVLAALDCVSKRFGGQAAVQELSLEVRPGEVLGLLGPNGAGKTTTLRLLCGLIEPDSGRVSVAGHDVRSEPIAARKNLGYVPDGAPLYSNLSPLEHLRLVGRLHGMEGHALELEARRLIEAFDLAGRRDDPIGGFSRGMRQKVAIACALLPRPPLLVLDEPLTGLDTSTSLVIKALIRGWAERGGAVIVTSHLLEIVERTCNRMALLADGRLQAQGSFEELQARAGGGSTLEEVFKALTQAEDPATVAAKILGS